MSIRSLSLVLALFLVACEESKKDSMTKNEVKENVIMQERPKESLKVEKNFDKQTTEPSKRSLEKTLPKEEIQNTNFTEKLEKTSEETPKAIELQAQKLELSIVEKKDLRDETGEKNAKKEEKVQETKKKVKTPIQEESPDVIVRTKINELKKLLPGEACVEWINKNADVSRMAKSCFKRDLSQSSSSNEQYFYKTFNEFIAANIVSFLPLIKDYEVQGIILSSQSKQIKKFVLSMKDIKSGEKLEVIVLTTNQLKIVNIFVNETDLLSLLQNSVNDVMGLPEKDREAAWNKEIAKAAIEKKQN